MTVILRGLVSDCARSSSVSQPIRPPGVSGLAAGAVLGDVLNELADRARPLLPDDVQIRWLDLSQEYQRSGLAFQAAFLLALTFGPGAEPRHIIGLAAIGGVLAATLLTLVLVPVLYLILAQRML
jgi:multidrug efflux pump subunit AcrB